MYTIIDASDAAGDVNGNVLFAGSDTENVIRTKTQISVNRKVFSDKSNKVVILQM